MFRPILISMILLTATPAMAAPVVLSDRAPVTVDSSGWQEVQRQISPSEAKAIALRRVPGGEVLDIQRTRDSYRVRVLDRNGRRFDIVIDARTGRIR